MPPVGPRPCLVRPAPPRKCCPVYNCKVSNALSQNLTEIDIGGTRVLCDAKLGLPISACSTLSGSRDDDSYDFTLHTREARCQPDMPCVQLYMDVVEAEEGAFERRMLYEDTSESNRANVNRSGKMKSPHGLLYIVVIVLELVSSLKIKVYRYFVRKLYKRLHFDVT